MEQVTDRHDCVLRALDACLGVAGLPQSATGQAALFTGINVPQRMGRHVTGLPGPQLRELVKDTGLLLRTVKSGRSATFANAYSQSYLEKLSDGKVRPSVTTCLAQAAGVQLRTQDDLEAGRAATWDIVGDCFGLKSDTEIGRIEPRVVGRRLADLAADHGLTIFETFLPDLVGHGRVTVKVEEVVRRLDELVGGILSRTVDGLTIVLTSDHGNFESCSARGHTRNPVPLLAIGPGACYFRRAKSLTDVAPKVLEVLGEKVPPGAPR